MTPRPFLGLALVLGVLSLAPTRTSSVPAVPLSEEAMASTRGGVVANIVWPPSGPFAQSYDNLRFQANVTNFFGTPNVVVGVFSGDTKTAAQLVSTPAPSGTGQLHTRTNWPFPGGSTVRLRYVDDQGNFVNALGTTPSLTGQSLLPDVKVHTVKFWNLNDDSGSTSVPGSVSQAAMDLLTPVIPDSTSNTIDGIYAESCPVGTKTQWRYAGTETMSLNDISCVDMASTMVNSCTPQTCMDTIWNVIQNDPNNVHIVYVDTLGCGWSGAHWVQSGGKYLIVMTDNSTTNPEFHSALMAHELGHAYVGGHTNNQVGSNCGDPSRFNRNLMCSNVGRLMTNTQCTNAQASTLYVDRN